MKNCFNLLIFLLIFSAFQVYAGAVDKCVDETGKVTYTDKGCKSKESSKEAYLLGTSTNSRYKNKKQPAAQSFKVSEIGGLTEQALVQCGKQAGKYFAGTNSKVTENSEVEFQSVVDRSLQHDKVAIVLAGTIRVNSEKDAEKMKIQCSASRSRETEWVLVFRDMRDDSKTSTAAK